MIRRKVSVIHRAASAMALAVVLGACGHSNFPLHRSAEVPAPRAYVDFCERSHCADDQGRARIPATERVHAAIQKAHQAWRNKFEVVPEPEGYDHWQAITHGDCEDFALLLRDQLRALFPDYAAAFNIATAYTEMGRYHAVLAVHTVKMRKVQGSWKTTENTLICDVRYSRCATWQDFPYAFHLIQDGQKWERVQP